MNPLGRDIVNLDLRIYFLLLLIVSGCSTSDTVSNSNELLELSCDAEKLNPNDSSKLIVDGNSSVFINSKGRSSHIAHSGDFSIKSDKSNKYLFNIRLKDLKADDQYKICVWKSPNAKSGKLVVQSDNFWSGEDRVALVDSLGWQKIEFDFYIPPSYNGGIVKVYFWNPDDEIVYVDDFSIEKVKVSISEFDEEPLKLLINDANFAKLQKLRIKAFKENILITDDDSYVKAVLSFEEEKKKAKIRFKGDWLDHIKGYKWSFRISLKGGETWRGMRTFNVQSPFTRNHLSEWLAHKIAEKEDVLTTRYDFIPLEVNDKNVGLYVYEEHFEKQLIESKNRREGPILKFTEDQFWDAVKHDKFGTYSPFASSRIVPYKMKRTLKDEKLKAHFLAGKNLLHAYKTKSAPVDQIFDLDKMAKYLAFIDFVKGYHGLRWHNIRFYYNPFISKLEPIAYDMNTSLGSMKVIPNALIANVDLEKINPSCNEIGCTQALFRDSLFYSAYIGYVEYFSNEEYLNEIYREYNEEINLREGQLKYEFPEYSFDHQFLYQNQNAMRLELAELKELTFKDYSKRFESDENVLEQLEKSKYPLETIEKIVHIHREKEGYTILNYSLTDIEIWGYKANKYREMPFKEKLLVSSYDSKPGEATLNISVEDLEHFIVDLKEQGEKARVKVLDWPSPSSKLDVLQINDWPDWIIDEGENLRIVSGNYNLREPLVVPQSKKIVVEAGVNIDITNEAYIWSYSSVDFLGTKDLPIIFRSSDRSARGITILQAGEESHVNYTSFIGFNTFKEGSWELTGAVNWYESTVKIRNSNFKENQCEDALNIVRSNFDISGCSFQDIYGDAFDADFCKGIISESDFNEIGNDAIDFSGSQVEIVDVKITDANDKAISGGEASRLTIRGCDIDRVNIAIASKDRSDLKVSDVRISNSIYGLVAYVKKKEYGPAEIHASNCIFDNVEQVHLIERKSILNLENEEIIGDKNNLQKLFY
ncbi:MAG: hypothetical protein ACI8U0_000647 [Flavobacteriales bacterium]